MVRNSRYTLQSQALQRFEKNASTIRIFEKTAAAPRRSSVLRPSVGLHQGRKGNSRNTVVSAAENRLGSLAAPGSVGFARNVTLMRAIYSEARWRMHAGVFAHQAPQPAAAAAEPSGGDGDPPVKQSSGRLKSAIRAVTDSAKQVCRGQRSLLTWQKFHEEELARKMIEEVKKDLEEGKIKTWQDTEEHISGVIKQLFPDDTEESKELMASFSKAADSFKVLQQKLDRLKDQSSFAAEALRSMMALAKKNIQSVNSKVEVWNDVKENIERIRRASIAHDSSLTSGPAWEGQRGSLTSQPTTRDEESTPSTPSLPSPPRLKRAIIRHKTEQPQMGLHTGNRAAKRSSTERFKSNPGEAVDDFMDSITSVRMNLKAALLAKRAAHRLRTHRTSHDETDPEQSAEKSTLSRSTTLGLDKDEKAVEQLEELLCHVALSTFGNGAEEVPNTDGHDEEGEGLPEPSPNVLDELGLSQPLEDIDERGSSPEASQQVLEEGMAVIVEGIKGRLRCQQMGYWSVLCEDGEIRVYESNKITIASSASPDDQDAHHSDDDGFGDDEVFAPPSGYRHGVRRNSWQRAKKKLALIKSSAVLMGALRNHAALPPAPSPAKFSSEGTVVQEEAQNQEAEEVSVHASLAGWKRHLMNSDDFEWKGPLHLMEEHEGRTQAWRHHLALLAAQGGSGGIEAIVADRHRRNFIIRSAAGPERDGSADGVEVHMPPPRFACGNWAHSSVVPPVPSTPPPSRGANAFGRTLDGPLVGSARTQARTPAPITVHGALREHPEFFSPSAGEQRWPPLPGSSDDISAARQREAGSRTLRSPPSTPATAGKAPTLQSRLWRLNLVTVDEPPTTPRSAQAGQRRLRSRGS
mmetsp:Transcript_137930/g.238301  ORF Transcript_137930/g.238301 Transcript_137930/m.238301 type:complete len:862 (-) Transcript_137930:7-2592(-)